MDHISYSQLNMYQRCGEQYRRRYVLGHRLPPGVALIRGRAVDEAVSEAYRQKTHAIPLPPLDYLLDLAAQRVEQGFEDEVALQPDEATKGLKKVRAETIDESVRMVRCHYDEVLPRVEPKLVQPKTEVLVPGLAKTLVGYIDVVERDGTIRDTKTTRKTPPKDAAEKSDQLAWYALGYKAATGRESPYQILDYLVDLKKGTKWEPRLAKARPEDQARLLARIREAVKGIEAGIFPPANPDTWWCSPRWCGYYETCPYVRRPVTVDLGELKAKIGGGR